MDRIKVERAIDGLAEWQKHVQTNSDIDRDISTAIEALKAQLSPEGTTSDTISKTETVEHLRRVLESTVPNTDYGEGFIDGVEFGISTVSTMPTIQPQSTTGQLNDGAQSTARSTDLIDRQAAIEKFAMTAPQMSVIRIYEAVEILESMPTIQPVATDTNVGDTISKFIDGLEEIFADLRKRHVDDSVCGLCEYDGAYMGQSGDWCNECPGFDRDDCFKLSDKTRKEWTEEIIKALPTVQPERKKGEWIEISSINHTYKCSECGRLLVNVADGRNNVSKHYPYCHCGADMRGERQK